MSHYGYKLATIIGPMENIKITTPNDFFVFSHHLDKNNSVR
jgi:D-ribitol-5-phosphate cytidylyltransferase